MERGELKAALEALIFVAEEPISANALGMVLGQDGVETAAVRQVLEEIVAEYGAHPERGIEIREVAGGYQFRTKPSVAQWIQRLNVPRPVRLSQAAMETLAIVAYRQPIVRAEVEEIRGVDCGGVLKTLLERNLVRIVGKRDEPGTPLLYATTQEFLSVFNLGKLDQLPTLRDYHELEEQRKTASSPSMGEDRGEGDTFDTLPPAPSPQGRGDEEIAPIDPVLQVELDAADQVAAKELEEQIRALRHIEGEIFPKPVEVITVVENEVEGCHSEPLRLRSGQAPAKNLDPSASPQDDNAPTQ